MRPCNRLWLLALCALSSLVVGACDRPPVGLSDSELSVASAADAVVVTQTRVDTLLAEITRAFAISLADDGLRASVHASLDASPYREKKLHLRTTLQSDWGPVSRRVAAIIGRSPQQLDAMFDSIVDIEVYLPVPAHRNEWKGGSDLVVAFASGDVPPQGFLVGGDSFRLNAEVPPLTPTLMLTRAETSFSGSGAGEAVHVDGMGANGVMSLSGGAIWMTALSIPDDFEEWWQGAPEFEIHLWVQDGASGDLVDIGCAGEQRTGDRYFDYNNSTWYLWQGSALVATEDEVATAEDKFEFQVWERDSGAECDENGGGRPPEVTTQTLADIVAQQNDIVKFVPDPPGTLQGLAQSALGAILSLVTQDDDDWVGTIQWPPEGCWPYESGGVSGAVFGPSGGWATLNNTFGERDPLCLSVSITGPDSLSTSGTYEWTAEPAGGDGSYTHEWYRKTDHWYPRQSPTCHYDTDYQLVGTSQSYSSFVSGTAFDFSLAVFVTSGTDTKSRSKHVLVTGERECPT